MIRTIFFTYLVAFGAANGEDPRDCREPLGMASGRIFDSQIHAASVYNNETTYSPSFARLGLPGGYRANPGAQQAWIMVFFTRPTIITGIATQGYGIVAVEEWVVKFWLGYSDGSNTLFFKEVKGGKQAKKFDANSDSNTIVHNDMPVPESVTSISIMPITWKNNFALRFELYGCLADGYECLSTPCQNNGTCVDLFASYHCNCTVGFNGTNCQHNIDDCANSPCQQGGNCTDLINDFVCDCPPGYTGKPCNTDIDECLSSPCQHGGTCKDGVNGYKCSCVPGYGGENCEEETGFFLVVWLQVKGKTFTMDLEDSSSPMYKTNVTKIKGEIASILNQDKGFLSSEVTRFSPDSVLVVEISIECLKNSTNNIMNTIESSVLSGNGIFKHDYIKFGDSANSYCKPPNVTLPFPKTLLQATHISRHMSFTVSMPTEITCQVTNYIASYHATIYSINNSSESLQNEYQILGNLAQKTTTWKIPAKTLLYGKYFVKVTSVIENKRGAHSSDFGFIVVGETLLVSKIAGPSLVFQGIKELVLFNGSNSYDPDIGQGNHSGMNFIWLCRRDNETFKGDPTSLPIVTPSSNQSAYSGGCYGTGVGRLESSSTGKYLVDLDIDTMKGNVKYVIALLVWKGERSMWSEHSVYVKEEIDISLNCIQNCLQSVIPSRRLIIESTCEGLLCNIINNYRWELLHFDFKLRKWVLIPDFTAFILTYMNSPNLVTKENIFKGNTTYLLQLTAEAPGGIIDTTNYRFLTNSPPSGGTCDVNLQEGKAWFTFFNFSCSGWQDVDLPLTYKFRYNTSDGIELLFSSGISSSARARLPVGDKREDMKLSVQVLVVDSLDSAAIFWLYVKVTEPLMSSVSIEEAVGEQGEMNQYLEANNIELAAQRATSVLSVVNNASPKRISLDQKIEIKDSIVKAWSNVTVTNLEEIAQVSAVVTAVSEKSNEVSFESQKSILTLLENMTSILETEVANKIKNDRNEHSIQGVGSGLLHGVGNFIEIAVINASSSKTKSRRKRRDVESEFIHKQSISMVQKAVKLIDQVGSSLVKTKELYERPSVFKTKSLSMVIDRQKPSMIGGKTLKDEDVTISIPETKELLRGEDRGIENDLSTQMVSMAANPFTWDTSSQHVKSSVLDFKITNSNGSHMEVNNLNNDFELFVPVKQKGQKPPANQESYFVKPGVNGSSMQYHIINIPGDEYAVSIKIAPLSAVNLTLCMRYGLRPTIFEYNYTAIIPNYESCNFSRISGYHNCTSDPFTVTVSSAITGHVGLHYVGILYESRPEMSENSTKVRMRVRRDCFSSVGRQKRSLCVGVKDPPPTKSTSENLVLKYDPGSDVNYTMSVTIATCLFWNTTQQKWSSYGCKVGPQAKVGVLHCLCNHLSSFGGNFFVAPNPIDFNKVLQRFTDFDPKNFVVFFVVFGIFGLYLVALVIARRADKTDEIKATETLRLLSSNDHYFELSIYTGMWRNNGTTANVAAVIYGEQGESQVLQLTDRYSKRKLFARASVNVFMFSLPEDSLGPIAGIKLWHDNEGSNPSWYINQVVIHDLENDVKTYFICNRWLAVDKEDGEAQATFGVSSKEELSSFKYQFYSRISKSLGDGHLWLSVVTRPPHSPFTRAQRVSCCLSVLYCAMVVSAMFYQFGDKTKDTVKFGPLRLSIKQLMIGIQSALVVVPINLVIVTVFRNVKMSNNKFQRNSYSPEEHEKYSNAKQKTPGCLPHFFVYIGWFLCVTSVIAAGTFTIFYSLTWGGEISNQWLTSILIAYVQDIGVIQPIKVVALAVILGLIIKKPVEEKTSHSLAKADLETNTNVTIVPPQGEKLEEARTYRKNIVETFRAVGEILFYLAFVSCLFVFVYGNRGYDRYRLTKSIDDIFTSSFKEISTTQGFWEWSKETLVPGLYNTKWYRPKGPSLPEGYISSREAYLVGMPRFRQIRVKKVSPCEVEKPFPWSGRHFSHCILPYEPENEDRTPYNFPRWISVHNISIYGSLFDVKRMCPKPWRYKTSKELNTFSIQGSTEEYDGGGYVADLGYNSQTALNVIKDLQSDNWIDRQTSLVVVEFTVFEPTSSLFSHAKLIYEVSPPTGKPVLSAKVETLSLYESPNSSFRAVNSVIQILLMVFIFVYLISEIGNMLQQRCGYFASFWNWLNIVQLLSASTAVVVFFFKASYVSTFIKQIQANPYETTSMDYVLLWCNIEVYIISVVIFTVTIKFLRLLRFNRHICQMTASIKHSSGHIATYTFVFLIDVMAFGILGVLAFGHTVREYSNIVESLSSLFQKFLGGEMRFYELVFTNRILAPLFVFLYMTSMSFILINMFVAILNDSYESVRHLSGGKFPDSDLGNFMRDYYQKRFRVTHDVLKRKFGRFGYRAKKYDPQKEETKASHSDENHLCSYTRVNLGYSSESLICPGEYEGLIVLEENKQADPPEILLPPIEVEPFDSTDVAMETATTASVATTSTTTELLDLISDLPESLVDDEDTVDVVRERLSNVGAILRLSKRSYRRFSATGDKFVVQRDFRIKPAMQVNFTPEPHRKHFVTLM